MMHFTACLFEFYLLKKKKSLRLCYWVNRLKFLVLLFLSILWQRNPTMKKMHLSQLHVKAGELPFVAGKVSETKCSQ